jgi:hypothetical protein
MSRDRESSWITLFDDVIGIIVIVVAVIAVLELTISFAYALEVLSLGILAIGIAWIVWSIFILRYSLYARVFMFITGLAAIIISLVDFIFLSLTPEFLIIYPAIAMLLVGSSRIVLGVLVRDVPIWIQMLQVLAGILTLNLAAFVFIFPNAGFSALMVLLVISLIANGLVRLVIGRTTVREKCRQPDDCP